MPSAFSRLSRVSAAVAITGLAFAFVSAPAAAAGYLKLGDIKGEASASGRGKEIHIESFSWGATQTAAGHKLEPVRVTSWSTSGAGDSAAESPSRDMTMKGSKIGQNAAAAGGEKGGTADINIGVGELQEATISKSMDSSSPRIAQAVPLGARRNRTAPAGSLSVKVPAGTCKMGARYPTAEMGDGRRVYTMTGVVVARCTPERSSDGSIPTETLSLNFDKIVWK